jgi:N-acetylmuramoyl-L-alanine amidase CwlA
LKRKFYNATTELTEANITASTEFVEMLALDLEAPQNVKDGWSGNVYTGYFKAPATAKYRFYVSCDDECSVRFSTVNKDPSAATKVYTSDGWTSYRSYLGGGRKITEWFNLNSAEYYYMEVKHI